jgi:hypothetical protein
LAVPYQERLTKRNKASLGISIVLSKSGALPPICFCNAERAGYGSDVYFTYE